MSALPDLVRKALEANMKGYVYQSEFARKYIAVGREEGLRAAAFELARAKLGDRPDATIEPGIGAIHDVSTLTELIVALARASDGDEVIAIVRRMAPARDA